MSTQETQALSEDAQALLARLPTDGSTKGNIALQRELGWDADRYYVARDDVEDAGLLVRGRGRGGTVRLTGSTSDQGPVVAVSADVVESPEEVEAAVRGELALYEPMRGVIAGEWARDHRANPLAVEITAQQGRRPTGGIWSRPDIVSVEVRTFAHVPGKHIELVTFEVKPSNGVSVQAVYEALAHRRAATRSYVLVHVPLEQEHDLESVVADVAEVARSHGIGLVTANDPSDYQTWEERETAERIEPDPERLDSFISTQLNERARQRIITSVR
jgi:hypothetical protein